jgi:putative intracellular protease/amidase
MKILMVLTSHSELGNTGKKTGFWIEEFAAPCYVFKDAGASITIASPKGGQPPIDPSSDTPENQTPAVIRFKADENLQKILSETHILSTISSDDYDGIFYPGGHGPLWDLTNDVD